MHPFSRFFCHLLLPLLLTLSSSLCLAADSDEARRKDTARQRPANTASNDAGRRLPPAVRVEKPAAVPSRSRPTTDRNEPASKFRSARRLMRTRRLLLAALRVWELKNGYDFRW